MKTKTIVLLSLMCLARISTLAQSSSTIQSPKKTNMKEYVLLVRLPLEYGPEQAKAVREKWNALTEQWKRDSIWVTSFVFPGEGYAVSGKEMTVSKTDIVSDNKKVISSIVVRAAGFDEALRLAKQCPVLEQNGVIEIREVLPRPVPVENK